MARPGSYTPAVRWPPDLGVIDLMIGVPSDRNGWQRQFAGAIRDAGSRELRQPAGYMFKDLPDVDSTADFTSLLLAEMDRFGIAQGLLPVAFDDEWGCRSVTFAPARLLPSFHVDPNDGSDGIRALRRAARELGVVAVTCFPAGTNPARPLDHATMYPIYATCIDLDLPAFVNVGVPGPRVPMASQHADRLDRVCADFPDLTIVTRHGAEPWTGLLIELMRTWPGLHYSTSAFAPRHYPSDIVAYANADGADKVLYAGYFPMGLSLERIFAELPTVPFLDHVWPKFLRDNASRVLRLT